MIEPETVARPDQDSSSAVPGEVTMTKAEAEDFVNRFIAGQQFDLDTLVTACRTIGQEIRDVIWSRNQTLEDTDEASGSTATD
ncbi:MAG: hypothetical protein HYY50_03060 [Candidatus Kerfeldbacteria bacterium]|nr:hypothetical protein [Candidatus Kerfeldbacteria bacterium]